MLSTDTEDNTFISHSPDETRKIAAELAKKAAAGAVYTLEGDLGAGKTVFAKGFAAGLDYPCPEEVVSPTFALMQIYEGGRLTLYHFDVYRLEDEDEALDIGMDEYLYGDGTCLIEWASRVRDILPESYTEIRIERIPGKAADDRTITVKSIGSDRR